MRWVLALIAVASLIQALDAFADGVAFPGNPMQSGLSRAAFFFPAGGGAPAATSSSGVAFDVIADMPALPGTPEFYPSSSTLSAVAAVFWPQF
jgi:hypothetical protein